MRDKQQGAIAGRLAHAFQQGMLGLSVEAGSGIIEHHDAGIPQQCPGKRHSLLLASRKGDATLADEGIQSIREVILVRAQQRDESGLADLFGSRVGPSQPDVVRNRAAEQERLLRHISDLLAEHIERQPPDTDAFEQDFAPGRVVQPRHEAGKRGLAAADRADDRQRLAFLHGKAHVADSLAAGVRVLDADGPPLDRPADVIIGSQRIGRVSDPRAIVQ